MPGVTERLVVSSAPVCAECGHIGCCDSSPSQHASKHAAATGHPIIASFEPGEDWFFDYETQGMIEGVELLPPHSHPINQPAPGPAGRVPADWESLLNPTGGSA
ncbi:MAG: UBP-type zinc finger domain-containing protein [Terriglobales bacterium]